jgi:hypothetical protein
MDLMLLVITTIWIGMALYGSITISKKIEKGQLHPVFLIIWIIFSFLIYGLLLLIWILLQLAVVYIFGFFI